MVKLSGESAKILYLTYDGLTDALGQSQVLPYLCGLSGYGYSITIISFEKPVNFHLLEDEITKICNTFRLTWIPLIYHKNPPIFSTLYDLYNLKRVAKNLYLHHKFKVVHCRSYLPALTGMWLKKKFGLKLIFDMRGFWADERVDGGLWKTRNPVYRLIYKYFKIKERELLIEANKIISLTENAQKEILSWNLYNASSRKTSSARLKITGKISVIPTCADTTLFDPTKVNSDIQQNLKNILGLKKEDYVLLYLGSLGTWYMLDEMLEFFHCLAEQKINSVFIFLTRDHHILINKLKEYRWILLKKDTADNRDFSANHTHEESHIYYYASSGNRNVQISKSGFSDQPDNDSLTSKIILTSSPRAMVPYYISLCSSSIFFIRPTYSKKASSATKMGEVLSMGKPVIVNNGWGDIDKLIELNNIGWMINSLSKDEYKKIINQYLFSTNPDPFSIRHFAVINLSLEKGIIEYDKIYKELINSSGLL